MNPAIIHQQLNELLETIQEQLEEIRQKEGKIPMIEFDILRENVRKFYDQLHLLQRLSSTEQAPSPVPPPHPAPSPPASPASPSRPEIRSVERPKAAVKREEAADKRTSQVAGLDLFAEEESMFNIRLREAREASLPSKTGKADHLKTLISINDKFIFINELFDGSLKEYNDAIDHLNGCGSKQEALEFLDNLRRKNLWEFGSGTLLRLKDAVEKYHH